MSLAGRVSIITGAGRGIGLAAAKLFVAQGGRVFLSDLDLTEARSAFQGNSSVGFLEADVTKEDQVSAMAKAALEQFGQVDAAVMNAGILAPIVPWLETSDIDKMNEVNIKGSWLTAKHAVKAMLDSPSKGEGGSLVGAPGMSGYCGSKWAVRGLSLSAAQEFAPYGIRSNCVQPGATATEMFESFPDERKAAVKDSIPFKRVADPNEIAEVMLFLVSDKSSYMNGSSLAVHGGKTPT
ncbi:short-chain dehydrogenase/reductase SDR [Leucosporidium creatinivorum]|uniref:Short-chain dehydrogenase/reductase SDR n=1 Tax=Leucosporidium creatinivorum TaxID=106004 RepID=A0A1Y2G112_9BASI|nr:short-chain dehydrogenase/reductase SDR [Leucosporidium creatinivorum]